MKIRTYKDADIENVLALWNETLAYHPIDLRCFTRKILLDVNFDRDGFFLAEDEAGLCGFAYAVKRKLPLEIGIAEDADKGFITALGVRKGMAFQSVGAALLEKAEAFIKADGERRIMVSGYTPEYFHQGICPALYPEYAALLEENGYAAQSDSASMELDLTMYQTASEVQEKRRRLLEEGYYIGPLRHRDIVPLLEYVLPGWRYRYRRLLREEDDMGKIRVAVKDGKVIGANMFGDPYDGAEAFGPFSVSAEYQGKGIGQVLLADCLDEMKKRGLHAAWIQWAHYKDAAGAVYRKAGFRQTGIYIIYSKE